MSEDNRGGDADQPPARAPQVIHARLTEDHIDGGWIAELPSRPGCMSDGSTVSDALRNLADAYDETESVAP